MDTYSLGRSVLMAVEAVLAMELALLLSLLQMVVALVLMANLLVVVRVVRVQEGVLEVEAARVVLAVATVSHSYTH